MGKSGYTQEFELDRGGRGSQRKSAQVSTSGGQAEPRSAPRTRARAGGRLVERPTFVHSVGILLLGLYWISGYATDLSHRLLSEKPYLSMISGVGLYVVVVFSGRMLRGVRTTIGKYWLFLIAWMIVATAFSTWRGGSLSFLGNYIPKIHLIFFLVCAFVVTVRHCRILIYANVIKGFVLLLTCVLEGRPDPINGRFTIPGSWIGGNPNELAIELLMCSAFFMFLLFRRNVGVRLLGVIGVTTALAYVLKTGSRGGLLTLGMFLVGVFIFSR